MFKYISKKLTKNYENVPLLYIMFNLNKYKNVGKRGSCELRLHPSLKDDEFIVKQLNNVVDYIRENYDMEDLSKWQLKINHTNDVKKNMMSIFTLQDKTYILQEELKWIISIKKY